MRSRWIINIVLLLVIAGIVAFLYQRPQTPAEGSKKYEISALKIANVNKLSVEFPAKAAVQFEKIDGYWHLLQPFKARADQMNVMRVLSIVGATTSEKFPATDLAKFGLDNPRLKLKLDDQEFLFGTFNPITSEQYVSYKDSVYLIASSYSEYAQYQITEFLDKSPIKSTEKIVGFDFSHLEQWEDAKLKVDLIDGQWKVSIAKAKPEQNKMNEWFDAYWTQMSVKQVEPYTPNIRANYPSFEVKLKDGKKVHFDKIQESPELILGRPDEGLMYHISPDIGFVLLNPPIGMPAN